MRIGLFGDVHGKFDYVFDIISRHPDVSRWFQVGDLGGESLSYPDFPPNFHFIQGNHENWDHIQKLKVEDSSVFLKNGSLTWYKAPNYGYCVGAFGGNHSPKVYCTHTKCLKGNNRRFFTSEDYDSLVLHDIRQKIYDKSIFFDVLLTHVAPSPYRKALIDIGVPIVTALIKRLKPTIHFFGHHHHFVVSKVGGTISIGLDRINRSYVLYDLKDNTFENIKA